MWRAYFIVGDLLACALTGAAAAALVQAAVPADWFVAFGMLAGMALGMLAGAFGGFLFTPLFGAMEVMLPASLSAMVAGMGAGMAQQIRFRWRGHVRQHWGRRSARFHGDRTRG